MLILCRWVKLPTIGWCGPNIREIHVTEEFSSVTRLVIVKMEPIPLNLVSVLLLVKLAYFESRKRRLALVLASFFIQGAVTYIKYRRRSSSRSSCRFQNQLKFRVCRDRMFTSPFDPFY